MKHREHHIQTALVMRLRWALPGLLIFAIPNGGELAGGAKAGKRLKDEGLLPGMPDLCVAKASKGFHALYIEVKTPVGRVSKAQKEIMRRLEAEGYRCVVVRSVDQG